MTATRARAGETDTRANPSHCGRCGTICLHGADVMTASCAMSTCGIGTCIAGFGDCDGMLANGGEVDTQARVEHCGCGGGRCTARPDATPACRDGACTFVCNAGRGDCDMAAAKLAARRTSR